MINENGRFKSKSFLPVSNGITENNHGNSPLTACIEVTFLSSLVLDGTVFNATI